MATQNRTSITTHPVATTTARTALSPSLPAGRLRPPDSGRARYAGDESRIVGWSSLSVTGDVIIIFLFL